MQQHIHIHNKVKIANGYINEGRLGPMPVSMYKNAFCSSMPLVINSIRNSEPQASFYHYPKPQTRGASRGAMPVRCAQPP